MIIVADSSPFVVLVSMPECGPEHLDGARTPRGQMRVDSGPSGSDRGAAGLNRSNWVETERRFGRLFKQAAGRSSSLVDAAARRSRR
jgi:hypothetical protein